MTNLIEKQQERPTMGNNDNLPIAFTTEEKNKT
jgi:hypothetical protein